MINFWKKQGIVAIITLAIVLVTETGSMLRSVSGLIFLLNFALFCWLFGMGLLHVSAKTIWADIDQKDKKK